MSERMTVEARFEHYEREAAVAGEYGWIDDDRQVLRANLKQAILDEGLKEYQALLRSIEWEGRAADEPSCPRCNGLMPDSVYEYARSAVSMYGIGHRSDCALNAMLMPVTRPCRTCSRPEWEHRASSESLNEEVAEKIAAMSDADYSAMVTDHPFRRALAAVRESQVSEGGV